MKTNGLCNLCRILTDEYLFCQYRVIVLTDCPIEAIMLVHAVNLFFAVSCCVRNWSDHDRTHMQPQTT